MQSITIRISKKSHNILKTLAAREGDAMQTVLEKAIETYRRQRFLEEVSAGYAKLKQNPAEWQAFKTETVNDATVDDGLDAGEEWNEDGEIE